MKKLDLSFRNGGDVLKSYWGYLSNGGLVLESTEELSEGQAIRLNINIQQSHMAQSVSGRVVRQHPSRDESIVALDPGDSGRLLRVALADAPVDVDAHLDDERVRLINVSDTGCCVHVGDDHMFPVGTDVDLRCAEFHASGCVVWALECDRGVMFSTDDDPEAREQLRAFLQSLHRAL